MNLSKSVLALITGSGLIVVLFGVLIFNKNDGHHDKTYTLQQKYHGKRSNLVVDLVTDAVTETVKISNTERSYTDDPITKPPITEPSLTEYGSGVTFSPKNTQKPTIIQIEEFDTFIEPTKIPINNFDENVYVDLSF